MSIKFKRKIKKFLSKLGLEIKLYRKSPFYTNVYETQKWILDKLKLSNPIIVDLGANVGEETIKYHSIFPKAFIHSFEPFPETVEVLKANTKKLNNISVQQFAVTDALGKRKLFINSNSDVNSLHEHPKEGRPYFPTDGKEIGVIDVETVTIDHFLKAYNIPRINILKIDVEGGEMDVLKGAKLSLEQSIIDVILFEAGFVNRFESEVLFTEILAYLNGFGYTLYNIYELVNDSVNGQLKRVNALVISESIRKDIIDKV